jgi:hypothetical protein
MKSLSILMKIFGKLGDFDSSMHLMKNSQTEQESVFKSLHCLHENLLCEWTTGGGVKQL